MATTTDTVPTVGRIEMTPPYVPTLNTMRKLGRQPLTAAYFKNLDATETIGGGAPCLFFLPEDKLSKYRDGQWDLRLYYFGAATRTGLVLSRGLNLSYMAMAYYRWYYSADEGKTWHPAWKEVAK